MGGEGETYLTREADLPENENRDAKEIELKNF
jgi:hypothetical protein